MRDHVCVLLFPSGFELTPKLRLPAVEVLGLNPGPITGYHDIFVGCLNFFFLEDVGVSSQLTSQPVLSTSFSTRY